jgi:hypothetical protein
LPFAKIHKGLDLPVSDFQFLIRAFVELSKRKTAALATRKKFLTDGLLRLKAVSSRVAQLSKEAEAQQVQVRDKEQRAKEAMDHISVTMTQLTLQQQQTDQIQKVLSKQESELRKQKEQIDSELADITPLLKNASEQVRNISSKDLTELKSMPMPPPVVRDVLGAVVLLLGERDSTWQAIRRVFSSPRIIDDITKFNPHDRVVPVDQVKAMIAKQPESFNPDTVAHCSKAAKPLCIWVTAMVKYCAVLVQVTPLE